MAAVATSLLTLFAFSVPTGYFILSMVAVLCWLIVGGCWGVRLVARLGVGPPTGPADARGKGRSARAWLTMPVLAMGTLVLVAADVPVWVTFLWSRPSMERAAKAAVGSTGGSARPAHIGWYGWCTPDAEGPAVYFEVSGAGFMDSEGFAYSVDGSRPSRGQTRPMCGPWYRWHEKF